ncbi:MAG: 2-octaprenyl-6-methoxyphenyl hydroxylase [Wenzhouxiangella sp.]|nr:MAG: 2-octaprenyl-6-methoxyphenyl hydroxylase [Wenzhouxiangella sp.]
MKDFDVILAGGGLVGAAAAVGLARAGYQVAVIEAAARRANHQPSYDDRTLVVNAASLNILSGLGLLPAGLARMPVREIRITRAGGFGSLCLKSEQYQREFFGAVIVARELGNVVLDALKACPGVTELCPATLETFTVESDHVRVRLGDGTLIRSRLLIGSDGTHSMVRQSAGIESDHHDYGQSAMIFNVRPGNAPAGVAWERFTPRGPLALLPQPEGRLGVVWIDRNEAIDESMSWSDDQLIARLEARFGPSLGGFSQPGRRARYPLLRQRTPRPVAERIAVIGNAANSVHPVSAQGFNLGLRDAASLIETLAGRSDPGDPEALDAYARSRYPDQEATVRYTDTLARAFTNPSLLARFGAGLGLAAHAALPGLSRRLVRSAMGFRDPVTRLARGGS